MTVGELIRSARKKRGLTQKALGEACGIAEPTIRRYELGKLNPKRETIEKIAFALGISHYALIPSGLPDCDSVLDEISKKSDFAFIRSAATRNAHLTALENMCEEAEQFTAIGNFLIVEKAFFQMNEAGQAEATEQIQILAQNPEYQREDAGESPSTPSEGKDTTQDN